MLQGAGQLELLEAPAADLAAVAGVEQFLLASQPAIACGQRALKRQPFGISAIDGTRPGIEGSLPRRGLKCGSERNRPDV